MDASTRSLKPPREWAEHMVEHLKESQGYDDETARKTMGEIWYNRMSKNKRREKRHEEGKEYGMAKSTLKLKGVDFGRMFKQEPKMPATIGEGWTDPSVSTALDAYEYALRKRKLSPEEAFQLISGTSKTARDNFSNLVGAGYDVWFLRRRGERMEDFCIGAAMRGLPMPDIDFADDRDWNIAEYSDEVVAALLKAAQTIYKKIDVESLEERVGEDLDGDGEEGEEGEDKEHKEKVLGKE